MTVPGGTVTQIQRISIEPLSGIGEVQPGDVLADIIADALGASGIALAESDIVVVTSKIMSKAEGCFTTLGAVEPGAKARELAAITFKDARLVELVLAESTHVVRAAPHVLITRHRLGLVMANAGIDQSNIGPGTEDRVLLLPADPDASAARLSADLGKRIGHAPAIVVSDSFGRPWRHGVVNVAIGSSGFAALHDRRGEADRDGRVMQVTQVALADMVASAAGLVTGEGAEGVPVAIVRGFPGFTPHGPAAMLVRPIEQDLFA
jgi:coenzyme F420-0:L-glutamate ligase/coenzyme F420-1:gamma-L-glutamate ligase